MATPDERIKARVLAFYLPQFHPTPENDVFWEPGFTEWTNVGKARPLYHGHKQPKLPTELGYYDLRVPQVRQQQADLARRYGVEGFCYWHYWFGGGKQLLEKPLQEVVATGKPDFPFCVAWANESWRGFDHGLKLDSFLIEQCYPGEEDDKAHFMSLLPAFRDRRYITVDGKLLFLVYHPLDNPQAIEKFVALWRRLAAENGLPGFYFVGITYFPDKESDAILRLGFDGINISRFHDYKKKLPGVMRTASLGQKLLGRPLVVPYAKVAPTQIGESEKNENVFPTVYSNWDHTPRSGRRGVVFHGSTPSLFRALLQKAVVAVGGKKPDYRLIFLKSWNEWAEGNYVEPDREFGRGYLEAVSEVVDPQGLLRCDAGEPLVSVLVTAYGQEKYLEETIRSLQAQTHANWEAIIVDDGSPDNVAEVARRLAETDLRVRFYHTDNRGVSAARNYAESKATGKYVMSLDGDDLLRPTYMEVCVKVLESRPEVRVAYAQWEFFGVRRHFCRLNFSGFNDVLLSNQIHVGAMLRRDDFERAGGFDEQMRIGLEDWEFWIRVLGENRPNSVYLHPQALFLYRQHRHSHNTAAMSEAKRQECQCYVFNKHRDKYVRLLGDAARPEYLTYVAYGNIAFLAHPVEATDTASAVAQVRTAVNTAKLMARAAECPESVRMEIIREIADRVRPLASMVSGHLSGKTARRFALLLASPMKFMRRLNLALRLQPKNWFRR